MNKYLLALVTALMLPLSAVAIEIGNTGISVDNEIEAVWSVDNEDYDLTLESGVTVPVWIMNANVNADFDIEELIEDFEEQQEFDRGFYTESKKDKIRKLIRRTIRQ